MDIKKTTASALLGLATLSGGVVVIDEATYQLQLATIPAEERLKAPEDKIVETRPFEVATTTDFYFSTSTGKYIERVIPAKQLVRYDYLTEDVVVNEEYAFEGDSIYSNAKMLRDEFPNTAIVDLSHKPRVYKADDGTIKKVAHNEVTTRRAYEIETRETILDQLVALAEPSPAYAAQDVYTSGSGNWVAPAGVTTADILIVGGGGSATTLLAGQRPGGAGGGGVIFLDDYSVTPGNSYAYSVGAGGSNSNGATSTFDGKDANGGGRAGAGNAVAPSGGSGGGGAGLSSSGTGGTGIQPTHPDGGFGSNGGNGFNSGTGSNRAGGGGGGAGGAGTNGATNNAGPGGAGKDYSATFGTSVGDAGCFAGGGGGNANSGGDVGGCGAGDGDVSGTSGVALGMDGAGGGAGGNDWGSFPTYSTGGSGAIIIKYTSAASTGQPVIMFE